MQLTRDRRQRRLGYACLVALLSGGGVTASRYHYHSRRSHKAYILKQYRPWGIQQITAKKSLPNSQQEMYQQRDVLNAYLLAIRGGSTYSYDGDQDSGYYDRYGDSGGKYGPGGDDRQRFGRYASASGNPDDDDDDPYDDRGRPPPSVRNHMQLSNS